MRDCKCHHLLPPNKHRLLGENRSTFSLFGGGLMGDDVYRRQSQRAMVNSASVGKGMENLKSSYLKLSDVAKAHQVSVLAESKKRSSCLCSLLLKASLLCLVLFFGSAFVATDYKEKLLRWGAVDFVHNTQSDLLKENKAQSDLLKETKTLSDPLKTKNVQYDTCKNQCKPYGSEPLPKGIVSKTSNFEMRPLWGSSEKKKNTKTSMSLLAIAVGIKQKENVDQMVKKFLSSDFVLMLFHYDGIVDEWSDLEWHNRAIHVTAVNQTKWWFAKRFLHPDVVTEYNYIFLWDEDLGVENFHPGRYLSIVEDEGLEISQPALDSAKSEVHHQITARGRRSRVHRRIYKSGGGKKCDDNSMAPPCTGWVEMMAPVFSKAAWHCAWYMIQNDLIHAWGLDMQLGYCAQGDRTKNVGVVDSEYIIHKGFPTLGALDEIKSNSEPDNPASKQLLDVGAQAPSLVHGYNDRSLVRRQSYIELITFKKRWKKAVEEDQCWVDPYKA